MDPTVATFVGFIAEPTDVLIMAVVITAVVITGDITDLIIAPTIMGLIVGTCVEFIVVHIEGAITDTMGRRHDFALWRPCSLTVLEAERAKRDWRPVCDGSDASSVAFSKRPGGTLYGPFGEYDGWWSWPRRRH
jgi:hypothetical protein